MNVRFCLIREGENEKKSTAFAVLFFGFAPPNYVCHHNSSRFQRGGRGFIAKTTLWPVKYITFSLFCQDYFKTFVRIEKHRPKNHLLAPPSKVKGGGLFEGKLKRFRTPALSSRNTARCSVLDNDKKPYNALHRQRRL